MKILAVCGFGVGSSMILKMSIEKVLKELNIESEVENTDLTQANSIDCDVIFTSPQLKDELIKSVNVPVYSIEKYMNLSEVKSQLLSFLNK